MIVNYKFLYNNGKKETIVQDAPEELHMKVAEVIDETFTNNLNAGLVLSDGKSITHYIKLQDVSSVKIEIVGE